MLLYEIGYSLTENDDFVFNINQLNFERVTKIAIDCFMVCIELQVRVVFSKKYYVNSRYLWQHTNT